ncbi:MAG: protease modulator HflC [Gammaproteobacteria bacterium]|nr:protease modulator HflC [Gammaproteobacteria bacterium]MDE0285991.1 protease modulator HflC [Gammaproteobacteria bacterium]MDE0512298.1 protease modulator HflC [Gammaproteobacteria bacterium]
MLRIIISVVLLAIVAYFSLFRVQEYEQAIVFRFKEIQRSDYKPGLHYMIPIINTAQKFETRLLNLDQEPQRFLTVEKKDVIVDYYAKWIISDVEKFYVATRGGDVQYATGLLGQRINRALRDEFGKRTVQEVVAGERGEILDVVETTTDQLRDELGITVVDVRTKRIDLPEEVSNSVYARMRAERTRVAKDFRARGEEAAERIRANADREREIILANAYKDAETVRGEGDASATEIYAGAFGKDEEFYTLYRSLNAYRTSFSNNSDILLLEPDSDFFRYFNNSQGE